MSNEQQPTTTGEWTRDKLEALIYEGSWKIAVESINAAIAAEREKWEGKAVEDGWHRLRRERDNLREQLAAAQATAKAHNDINGDICHIDITDTTALDAAIVYAVEKDRTKDVKELIAAARQPLVAALKRIAKGTTCYTTSAIAEAALANTKEQE